MNNYKNGKIYKITTDNSNDIYIGSTIQTLKLRLQNHESNYKTGIYCSSAEIIKQGSYKIVLIKDFACDSLLELETEEARFQRDMVCVNRRLARLTDEEKRQYNKEYQNQYYIKNKDEILEYQNQYYIENKNELLKYKNQYYIENKERLNEKHKQYYLENKDRLTKKFNCDCGGKYTLQKKSQHFKSLKHINFLKTKTKYIFKIKR